MAKISVETILVKAKSHIKKGELEDAKKLYQSVLHIFPKNVRAQQGLAALSKPKQHGVKIAPPQAVINHLVSLYHQGKLSAVVVQAQALTEQYPEAFIVWNVLGAANKGLGQTEDATSAFKRVTELNPTYAEGFNNMGVTLAEQGKLDEAIAAYNKALSIKPDYAEAYSSMGATLQDQGKLDEAIAAYKKALSIMPNYAAAYYNMGLTLTEQGKLDEAIAACNKALSIKPDYAEAYNNMGNALKEQGKLDDAIAAYNKALSIKPDYAEAYNNMGATLQEQENQDQAIAAYNKALSIKPDYAEAYYNIGVTLAEQGKLDEAIAAYNKALSVKPDYAAAYYNMGATLQDQGNQDQAIAAYNKALSVKPDYAEAYYNMGVTLTEQGKLNDAIAAYNKALSIKPDFAEACSSMGVTLTEQGKLDEAIAAYNKALSIKPDYAEAYSNLGNALTGKGEMDEAIAAYNKALSIKPDFAQAYDNMGVTLQKQGKLDEAIAACKKALSIKPDYADAYNNLGVTLQEQGKLNEAIDAYNKALSIKPNYAEACNNIASALQDQGKLDEAIAAYNKALSIKPDFDHARAQYLHQLAKICDWSAIEAERLLFTELGIIGKSVPPFPLLSVEDAPERHRLRSEIYAKEKFLQKPLPATAKPPQKPKRLRIGYFSADFHDHPVAYLIAKVLEQHNGDEFEVFGYSLHGNKQGEFRQRLINSFDYFTDVQGLGDESIAHKVRQDNIDIAIDLTGYTANARTGIFAYRAAPIQINYLGYPGTLGADFMDYIIADKNIIPEIFQKHYTEKKIYLPNQYQPQDNSTKIAIDVPSRFSLGLPEEGFVFCSINNTYKITPREFDIWMRLLKSVAGSVLWLYEHNSWAKENLLKEASARGVPQERLVFSKNVAYEKYLAQFRQADLYLDTFNYNAGATASNALWAGLPVLTKKGKSYTARMASSLLTAVGLPELITENEEAYEALALTLATDSKRLGQIKSKLDRNRLTQPLFDSEMYTRHLEAGYHMAYDCYFKGKAPSDIIVPK